MNIVLDAFRSAGEKVSRFTERWVPDPWIICLMLTVIAAAIAIVGAGVGVEATVLAWGGGMWNLLELAMQFTIAMVAAHACVSSRPVFNLLDRLAGVPNPDKPYQALLVACLFSLVAGYLNWALCLVACALFVPFLCRRNPRADVRLLIVGCYMGLGTVWHGGLSGSAPLILATPGNPLMEPATGNPIVNELVPVTRILFAPFNLGYLAVIGLVGLLTTMALHPRHHVVTLTREQVDAILPKPPETFAKINTPAGRMDHFRGWILLAAVLILYPLGHTIWNRGFGASWTINAYNAVFLGAALLLHGRPDSFVNACREGVGAAWGIIIQFPFYAGIFGIMNSTALGPWLGDLFANLATKSTYPLVVYIYTCITNLFVPSAGSKWLIEAPYLIPAGQDLGVSITTVTLAYMYGDSTTNLIQPFWAIPILAVTRVRFGDIVGYTFMVAAVCAAVTAGAMLFIPPDL